MLGDRDPSHRSPLTCHLSPVTFHLTPVTCFGLTLVEVLLSVVLLASGGVLLMQGLARGLYAALRAEYRLRAVSVASTKLAEAELALAQSDWPAPRGRVRLGEPPLDWQVQVSPVADDPRLEEVAVTVNWRQGRHPDALRLETLRRLPSLEENPS